MFGMAGPSDDSHRKNLRWSMAYGALPDFRPVGIGQWRADRRARCCSRQQML